MTPKDRDTGDTDDASAATVSADATGVPEESGSRSMAARGRVGVHDPSRVGEVIADKYRLTGVIGGGGMGTVYAAEHVDLPRKYALKLLRRDRVGDPSAVARFRREAYEAAATEHPAIVEIIDFGRSADGSVYLVMERLDGAPVNELIDGGPVPLGKAVDIVLAALDALEAAHRRGLVHRDIKPENLFLARDAAGREQLKVLDFGIAKAAGDTAALTQDGSFLGTPAYMSLEQVRESSDVDRRADIYSLGATLYELLTGFPPVSGRSLPNVVENVVSDRVSRDPRPQRPAIPEWLAQVVIKALARRPEDRFQTAAAMMAALAERREELGDELEPDARAIFVGPAPGNTELATPRGSDGGPLPGTVHEDVAIAETIAMRPLSVHYDGRSDPPPDVAPSMTAETLAARRRQRGNRLAAAVFGVAALGVAAWLAWPTGEGPVPSPAASGDGRAASTAPRGAATGAVVSVAASTPAPGAPPAPAGMQYFGGGRFTLGSSAEEIEAAAAWCRETQPAAGRRPGDDPCSLFGRERPEREVVVSPFFLDRHEVRNDELAAWLAALPALGIEPDGEATRLTEGAQPLILVGAWQGGIGLEGKRPRALPGHEDKPALYVSWLGAQRYCTARGARLPTEAEWALAAGGATRRAFPWGQERPRCSDVVYGRDDGMACAAEPRGPAPVMSAAGDVTPEGVHDLGGNAREWVLDGFRGPFEPCDPPCRDPGREEAIASAPLRVIRGGGWLEQAVMCRSARRGSDEPTWTDGTVGFRCALSAR